MAELDYLKVGNCVLKTVCGYYTGNTQETIIRIEDVKINKVSAWVNGGKYKISGNCLYDNGDILTVAITPVSQKIEDDINKSFDEELMLLEKKLTLMQNMINDAKNAQNGDSWLSKYLSNSYISYHNDNFLLEEE